MVTVYFVRDGSKIRVDGPEGTTLMEAAKESHVRIHEIPADCGGSCACCTCHICRGCKQTCLSNKTTT